MHAGAAAPAARNVNRHCFGDFKPHAKALQTRCHSRAQVVNRPGNKRSGCGSARSSDLGTCRQSPYRVFILDLAQPEQGVPAAPASTSVPAGSPILEGALSIGGTFGQ
jgi:hypothetical protein